MRRFSEALVLVMFAMFGAQAHADDYYDEDDAPVRFSGSWQTISSADAAGGTVKASNVAGASVTLTFTGTNVTWLGYRCACAAGIARVYLDGELDATVDTYAASPEPHSRIYTRSGLQNTSHTLTIEVTGERHSAGQGAHVVIDQFVTYGFSFIQENDHAIDYTGDWTHVDDPYANGGRAVISRTAGATATLSFFGTSVRWLGFRCQCAAGIANVFLDGQHVATVNGNLPVAEREYQAYVYAVRNLPQQQHTLRIEVTGTSAGQGAWVVLDGFNVLYAESPDGPIPIPGFGAPPYPWGIVTGPVTLRVTGQDDLYTTKVQFFANDMLIGEDYTHENGVTPYIYSITRDTSGIPSGSRFRITAKAFDADGNVGTSEPFWVTVQHGDYERVAPTLSFTAPVPGSTVSGTLNIAPQASDPSEVAWVSVAADDRFSENVVTSTSAPYTMQLDTRRLFDGAHNLIGRAMDFLGNETQPIAIPIVVDNRIQPGMVRIDEDDPSIVYGSGWGGTNSTGSAGPATKFNWGDYASAVQIGSTATVTFDGVGIRWIGFGCDMCGDATVSIDGGPAQPVGLGGEEWGRPGNNARIVYSSPALPSGRHTLTVTVIDRNLSNPTLYPVVIDGFEILK